ncbi:MAG: hypothetical protein IKS17_08560 [Firmicutes bacterium]|nr:hypothetical protein [Bacillota bacterium]
MGAKIYVVKLRQILKAVLALALAAAVIITAAIIISRSSRPTYAPGVYCAGIMLRGSPVNVEVEVSAHRIESVRLTGLSETQQVFYPLFSTSAEEVADKIVAEQSCDIDIDSDHSVTGSLICDAARQALEGAIKN